MRDRDIRAALHKKLIALYGSEPETLILHELGICSSTIRIDVAVVNGSFHGFEIKSDLDTLQRLPLQQQAYDRVFDTVTLIAGGKHLDKADELVPRWWGLHEVIAHGSQLDLFCIRRPDDNPRVDPYSLAQLLWREEALAILNELGAGAGLATKPRRALYQKLASFVPLDDLRGLVRERLKARRNWRSGPSRTLSGEKSRPFATSSRFLAHPTFLRNG